MTAGYPWQRPYEAAILARRADMDGTGSPAAGNRGGARSGLRILIVEASVEQDPVKMIQLVKEIKAKLPPNPETTS
jgi:hypothetical protein